MVSAESTLPESSETFLTARDRAVRNVQLYDVARTAHFERVMRSGLPTTILYRQRRYDFDETLAAAVGSRKVGVLGAFWFMLRNDVDVLEVAEPLVTRAAPCSVAAIAGTRLRRFVGRRRAAIVTYAIENKDPREVAAHLPLRARVKSSLASPLVPLLWRSLDRIAYGTSQARDLYADRFRSQRALRQRLVAALPTSELETAETEPRAEIVVFLGEFSERKGFPLLLAAWPSAASRVAGARLVIIGKGEGEALAKELAARDPAVEVLVDPPRAEIFSRLAMAKALVLPSQPRPRWREQVGLPIVEALGHGCLIVTTSETGLAEWLADHGHAVVTDPADTVAVADALVQMLESTRTPADVVADLPDVDGRAEAERWLLTGVDEDVR